LCNFFILTLIENNFYKWTSGQTFLYLNPITWQKDGWHPKCIVGRQSEWRPILFSCKGVAPCRTQMAPPLLAPLGHGRAQTRLAPCCLTPVRPSLSSSSLTLSILLISLSQRVPPPAIRPSGHSRAIFSPSRYSPRYPPPLHLENALLFCLGFE
jgi:hypothetical protein